MMDDGTFDFRFSIFDGRWSMVDMIFDFLILFF